jgi:hypothetical protein
VIDLKREVESGADSEDEVNFKRSMIDSGSNAGCGEGVVWVQEGVGRGSQVREVVGSGIQVGSVLRVAGPESDVYFESNVVGVTFPASYKTGIASTLGIDV